MRRFTEKFTMMFEPGEIQKYKNIAEAKGHGNLSNYIRNLLIRNSSKKIK